VPLIKIGAAAQIPEFWNCGAVASGAYKMSGPGRGLSPPASEDWGPLAVIGSICRPAVADVVLRYHPNDSAEMARIVTGDCGHAVVESAIDCGIVLAPGIVVPACDPPQPVTATSSSTM
jgi:hypothetical protein